MKINNQEIKSFYIKMLVIVMISCVFITVFWIKEEYNYFSNKRETLKNEYTTNTDNEAKHIVNSAVDYIKFQIRQAENDLIRTLKDRSNRVYDIAENIYKNNENLSQYELREILIGTVKNLKYDDGFNTYFISTIEGEKIFENNVNEIDKQLDSTKDENGNFIADNIYILSDSESEGYVEEYWKGEKSNLEKKIIYMKKFEPLELYIGTEEFVDDFISERTANIFQWLNSIKFGYENMSGIFAFDYEGNVLANSENNDSVNKNLWIMEEVKEVAKKNLSGDFINYNVTNVDTSIQEEKKAYVMSLPELEWIVGAEIYYPTIEAFKVDMKSSGFNERLVYIVLINILIMVIAVYVASRCKQTAETQMSAKIGEMLVDNESRVEKFNNELLYEIRRNNKKIKTLREKDRLTGVFNHNFIYEILQKEVDFSKANRSELSVVLIDIDYFKTINKTYGHSAGNDILEQVSKLIKENSVSPYAIGRYDGNCFLIVMPKTNYDEAYKYAEKVRRAIREYQFDNEELSITVSASLMEYTGEIANEIINKCEGLLQNAKENGGDRVEWLKS